MASGPQIPTGMIRMASSQAGADAVTAASTARPRPIRTMPPTMGTRGPNRSVSRAASGLVKPDATLDGTKTRPVASDDKPRSCWR